MGQTGNKLLLLLWKNWKLQIRKPFLTLFQILTPVLFCSQLIIFRSLVDPKPHPDGKEFKSFEPSLNYTVLNISRIIKWSPCNPNLEEIMMETASTLILGQQCVNSSKELEHILTTEIILNTCGVQFDDALIGDVPIPKQVNMKVRFPSELRVQSGENLYGGGNWHTDLLFPIFPSTGPREPNRNEGAFPEYSQEGFLAIQKEISSQIIKYYQKQSNMPNANKNLPVIKMQRFPYPPWIEDPLILILSAQFDLMIIIGFIVSAIFIVKALTVEKETQVKEAMKIMGLPNWLHWTAWFITSFLFFFIPAALVVFLFKMKYPNPNFSVLTLSDPSVIIFLMILYVCASITLCFAISVFFTQANIAAAVGALIWIVIYFPYAITAPKYNNLNHSSKILLCLASNSAISRAFAMILNFEGQGSGLHWNNIWHTTSLDDTLTIGHIMIMLVVDTFLYLLIALYVEAIYPGDYGVPRQWYFPFTRSFWCGQQRYAAVSDVQDNNNKPKSKSYEKEPTDLPIGIQIKHLSKMYRKSKMAVYDLSLNMYKGQITVLLGHNGAGKTTTMSMLTGLLPPTNGTATINGYDIIGNMDKVRESIGLCPQYNIIFNDLTVYEHLYFFGKLKGLDSKEIKAEVDRYTSILELQDKKNTRAAKLSGGMKRKLCIGIAMCGRSQIVLLDEPTAGVDPAARRAVWNLLQQEKQGRTILLSTHFMDEADLLGDRIAIMARGELQSCGTSFFLKKRFGAGYHLIIEKSPNCNVDAITEFLKSYIPNVKVKNNVGTELTYILPENKSNIFERMLDYLERTKSKLKIQSYGISVTTLEEVFMRIGADNWQKEQNELEQAKPDQTPLEDKRNYDYLTPHTSETALNIDGNQYLSSSKLLWNQVFAMFFKRSLTSYRSWILMLIQILLPVLFIIITMLTGRNMKSGEDLPDMDLNHLKKYENPITVINGSNIYKTAFSNITNVDSTILDYMDNDLSSNVLEKAAEDVTTFRRKYIIGASFSDNEITGWFNNEPYHSPPIILQYIMNTILKTELGSEYGIKIHNHPLPYSVDTKFQLMSTGASIGFQISQIIGLSLVFVSPFFVLFYVKERVSGAKHLQQVSGARLSIFWIVSFLWDFFIITIIHISIVVTLAAFQEDGFKTVDDLGRVLLFLILFTFTVLPLTYLASFLFDIPSSGYTLLAVFNLCSGFLAFMIITVLGNENFKIQDTIKKLHMFFLIFPHYTISSALYNMNVLYSSYNLCNTIINSCTSLSQNLTIAQCEQFVCSNIPKCCEVKEEYFVWEEPGVAKNILYFLAIGLILILILTLKELSVFKSVYYSIMRGCCKIKPTSDNIEEDDDVTAEKQLIRLQGEKEIKEYALVLRDLTKYYKKFLAVNNLCLGANKAECFGLLGVNGAGKTTTFKMLTGMENISSGDVWVSGINLKKNIRDVYKIIGYCPQFDALLENLTGRETLIMFCLLRGIKYDESKYLAEKYAKEFDFYKHIDKQVKAYSGGNKRKLSATLALIGDPQIVFMDEPTTGMDPATKRYLWNNINKVRDSGKCIILTSHSMEECEALCTRLAIMVNGSFRCLGSQQHLKNRYSQGYILKIKIKKKPIKATADVTDVNPIDSFIKSKFHAAELREQYQELFTYYIPDSSTPWSQMFGILEKGKKELPIEDYTLSQSSLEQVFLYFTKHQGTEAK